MRPLLYQLLEGLGMRFQCLLLFLNLPSQLTCLNGAMQRSHEVDTINGFFDKIISPAPQGLNNKRLISMTGNQ
jgi:hypothetical protein